jgi:hypothetical protein
MGYLPRQRTIHPGVRPVFHDHGSMRLLSPTF